MINPGNTRTNENKVYLSGFCEIEYKKEQIRPMLETQIEGFLDIMMPENTYKGFAFIVLEHQRFVRQLLQRRRIRVGNTWLNLSPFKSNPSGNRNSILRRKIFVHNIPDVMSENQFSDLFSKFGLAEEAYICKRSKNKERRKSGRRIGYVVFADEETANNVTRLEFVLFRGAKLYVLPVKDKGKVKSSMRDKKISRGNFREIVKFHATKPTRREYFKLKSKHGWNDISEISWGNYRFNKR